MRSRRHPRQVRLGEVFSCDHCQYSWQPLGFLRVHALEPSVGIGTAHQLSVNHSWQMHVVDVIAFALNKAKILFAFDGMAHATNFRRCLVHHFAPPCAILLAANCTALTMFW